jgi:hypothetical protein
VPAFCVLLVADDGVPVLERVETEESPIVGDLIRIEGTLAEVTHVWPGNQGADLPDIRRPRLEGRAAFS